MGYGGSAGPGAMGAGNMGDAADGRGNTGTGGLGSGPGTGGGRDSSSPTGSFDKAADISRDTLGLTDPNETNSLASRFGSTVKGFFGSVVGTVAGTAIGGPVGGIAGGMIGSGLTDAFSDKGTNEKTGSIAGRTAGGLLGGVVGSGLGIIGTGAVKAGSALGSHLGSKMGAKTDAAQPTGLAGLAQDGLANLGPSQPSSSNSFDAPHGGQGGRSHPLQQETPDPGLGLTASADQGYTPDPAPDPSIAANERAELARARFKESYNSLQSKFNQQMTQALGAQSSYL